MPKAGAGRGNQAGAGDRRPSAGRGMGRRARGRGGPRQVVAWAGGGRGRRVGRAAHLRRMRLTPAAARLPLLELAMGGRPAPGAWRGPPSRPRCACSCTSAWQHSAADAKRALLPVAVRDSTRWTTSRPWDPWASMTCGRRGGGGSGRKVSRRGGGWERRESEQEGGGAERGESEPETPAGSVRRGSGWQWWGWPAGVGLSQPSCCPTPKPTFPDHAPPPRPPRAPRCAHLVQVLQVPRLWRALAGQRNAPVADVEALVGQQVCRHQPPPAGGHKVSGFAGGVGWQLMWKPSSGN